MFWAIRVLSQVNVNVAWYGRLGFQPPGIVDCSALSVQYLANSDTKRAIRRAAAPNPIVVCCLGTESITSGHGNLIASIRCSPHGCYIDNFGESYVVYDAVFGNVRFIYLTPKQ